MTALQSAIKRAIAQHGGLRPAAKALQTDHAYLLRLRDGDMDNPAPELLAKLGLERKVIYRKIPNCVL